MRTHVGNHRAPRVVDEMPREVELVSDIDGLTPTEVRQLLELQTRRLLFTLHELRRPLTVANANLDMLLDETFWSSPAAVRASLRQAMGAIHEMCALADGLAVVARIEKGVDAPRRERSDLHRLALDAASSVEFAAISREVRVELRAASDALEVDVDPDQLRVAIVNLLSNAVDHSPPGSRVTLRFGIDERAVRIAVTDDGPGIGATDLERVFEPWYRGSNGSDSGGLGLGLWIVREIAEWHGGSVMLENSPARGATFSIVLPTTRSSDHVA